MSIKFPEGKDKLLIFEITMKPDEGIYRCCPIVLHEYRISTHCNVRFLARALRPCSDHGHAVNVRVHSMTASGQSSRRARDYLLCLHFSGEAFKFTVRSCCRGGCFTFSFNISTAYPHDAPKVKCKTKVRPLVPQVWCSASHLLPAWASSLSHLQAALSSRGSVQLLGMLCSGCADTRDLLKMK